MSQRLSKRQRALQMLADDLAELRRIGRTAELAALARFPEAALLAAHARAEWFRRGRFPGECFVHEGKRFAWACDDGRTLRILGARTGNELLRIDLSVNVRREAPIAPGD